jgi:hypothetical protein
MPLAREVKNEKYCRVVNEIDAITELILNEIKS